MLPQGLGYNVPTVNWVLLVVTVILLIAVLARQSNEGMLDREHAHAAKTGGANLRFMVQHSDTGRENKPFQTNGNMGYGGFENMADRPSFWGPIDYNAQATRTGVAAGHLRATSGVQNAEFVSAHGASLPVEGMKDKLASSAATAVSEDVLAAML